MGTHRSERDRRCKDLLTYDSEVPKGDEGDQDGRSVPRARRQQGCVPRRKACLPDSIPQDFDRVVELLVLELALTDLMHARFETALPRHELQHADAPEDLQHEISVEARHTRL